MKLNSTILESVLYWLSKNLLTAYSLLSFKINLISEEEIPPGPKIFVINHPTTSDPFISIVYLKNKVHILVLESLFKIPVFGFILKHTGQIPVNPQKGIDAFLKAKSLLEKGKSVVFFAEGKISSAECSENRPKTGAARLALETNALIIPIGIGIDSEKIKLGSSKASGNHDPFAYWYLNGPYVVSIGKAIRLRGSTQNRDNVCFFSKIIMDEIWELTEKSKFRLELKNRKLYQANFNNFILQKSLIRVLNQIVLAVGLFRH